MRGGKPGDYSFLKWFWDPLGLAGTKELTPAEREEKLTSELKNGRCAPPAHAARPRGASVTA